MSELSCFHSSSKPFLPHHQPKLPSWRSDVLEGIIREQRQIVLQQLITLDLKLRMQLKVLSKDKEKKIKNASRIAIINERVLELKYIKEQVIANLLQGWQFIIDYLQRHVIKEASLQKSDLIKNAFSPYSRAVLYLFTMESWLYHSVNKATRHQESKKIKNLAPFTYLLFQVLQKPHLVRNSSKNSVEESPLVSLGSGTIVYGCLVLTSK